MIRKIILWAVSLYLFCNSAGCTEKEEKSVPQPGKLTQKRAAAIDSIFEEISSELRRREPVIYFQNHIEPVLDSYLKDGITPDEYTKGIAKLKDYRKRYADLEKFDGNKPDSDYYLKEGLSNQAEIELILSIKPGEAQRFLADWRV